MNVPSKYEISPLFRNAKITNKLSILSEPITTVLGGPDLYIHEHSTINLTCIVRNLPIPPSYVIWTHNNEVS